MQQRNGQGGKAHYTNAGYYLNSLFGLAYICIFVLFIIYLYLLTYWLFM